eukprot:1159932-Pelagomonas_calceolata.AAC.3
MRCTLPRGRPQLTGKKVQGLHCLLIFPDSNIAVLSVGQASISLRASPWVRNDSGSKQRQRPCSTQRTTSQRQEQLGAPVRVIPYSSQ